MQNNYKGFSLFNDIEDTALRNHNRATVLANIAEDYQLPDRKINVKGVALIMGYFQTVAAEQRKELAASFATVMSNRGFAIVQ